MARNVEKDKLKEEERRLALIKAGFLLFSSHSIEEISMERVAKEAQISAATMYNYFQNKENLAIAISAYIWNRVWNENLEEKNPDYFQSLNAYELIEYYCDQIILLYQKIPQILRFSGNYKSYICRHIDPSINLDDHLHTLEPLNVLFHSKYIQAQTDHSIRTDIPEEELMTTTSITFLGTAERYAMGIVWTENSKKDHSNELIHLKNMILKWLKTE